MAAANLCFDDLSLIVEASFEQHELPFVLDTGATTTDLWPKFARVAGNLIRKSGTRESHTVTGMGGSRKFDATSIPKVILRLGGRSVTLQPAHVLETQQKAQTRWFYGNLGIDLLGQAQDVAIDFRTMTLELDPDTGRRLPYSANGNGIVNGSGPQFASFIPSVPLYEHNPIPGVTQPGTVQWLNPDAFVSTVDPRTGACFGGDSPKNCQFGNLGRNALRGPNFTWSDFYLSKWFPLTEQLKLRFDVQFFNVFNHPNFGLPGMVLAGIPGKPSTQTGFGALTYATSPPTGLLGVGLGGDSTPRMTAFQLRLEF
jgi:hypothetical protein